MTEAQVIALQQITTALAAFEGDHRKIVSGELVLDKTDQYDDTQVGNVLEEMEACAADLCKFGGDCTL